LSYLYIYECPLLHDTENSIYHFEGPAVTACPEPDAWRLCYLTNELINAINQGCASFFLFFFPLPRAHCKANEKS
jgi:hypothetical protein